MIIAFTSLVAGDNCRIVGFSQPNSNYRKKLLAMGLTPGTAFTVKRLAPLGDPIEIYVRGFSLSLRKTEANILAIEKL